MKQHRINFLLLIFISFIANSCFAKDKSVLIKPTDSKIVYLGRIDFQDSLKPTFSYPGVSIKAKFKGTSIAAILEDLGAGDERTTNYFSVLIDDKLYSVLKLKSGVETYQLAQGLKDTNHTVELIKRTESMVGKCAFHGFKLEENKSLLAFEEQKTLKFEFVGDSFTAGYGNDTNFVEGNPLGFTSENENNFTAWGAIATRKLKAQYVCTAYSGRGMYRNFDGSTTGTLPQLYDFIFPDDKNSPKWNHQLYSPDIITVTLGINDHYLNGVNPPQMLDSTSFVKTYIQFLIKLNEIHPKAKLICVIPSGISDVYPQGLNQRTVFTSLLHDIVKNAQNKTGSKIYMLAHSVQQAPFGEDWHPSNKSHEVMADEFVKFVKKEILK